MPLVPAPVGKETARPRLPDESRESSDLLRLALNLGWQGDHHLFLDAALQRIGQQFGDIQTSVYLPDDSGGLGLHGRHPRNGPSPPAIVNVESPSTSSIVCVWLDPQSGPLIEAADGPWEASIAIQPPEGLTASPLGVLRLEGRVGGPEAIDVAALKRTAQDLGWGLAYLSRVAAQRRELAQIRSANRELEAVIYTAAHDLTEPIRTITEFSGFLRDEKAAGLDEDSLEDVRRIHRGGLRLKRMVDDLLRFSKAGHAPTPLVTVDSAAIMVEALESLAALIRARGTTVTLHEMPPVLADQTGLLEVFSNLVSNAVKFNRHPHPQVDVFGRRTGNFVEFCVQDNGVGIPLQDQKRIFDLFFRLDSAPGAPAGSGAGLAIVKRLVERFGGRVWVDSTPGAGSRFRFTLRAAL